MLDAFQYNWISVNGMERELRGKHTKGKHQQVSELGKSSDAKGAETYDEVTRRSSPNELQELQKEVKDLSKRITEKDFKFHELSQRLNDYENESIRQRRLNESLSRTIVKLKEEISSNAQEYEDELARIEQEKQQQLEIHSKEAEHMRKNIASLKDNISIKEKIIPGLLQQLDNKNTIIDQTSECLASSVEDIRKLESEIDILTEERNTVTNELQQTIRDSGNATNEMYEVLRIRDKMAKDFVAYRMHTEKTIDSLNDEIREKEELVKTLLRKIESFKPTLTSISLHEAPENQPIDTWEQLDLIISQLRPWKTTAFVTTGGLIGGIAITMGYFCIGR